jgi:hypothetical protein
VAGRGPTPKDPARRARRNADPISGRVIEIGQRHDHAELPDDLLPDGDYWHPATLRWWARWVDSPLADFLPEVDWSELEATAVLHHEFMRKRTFTLASELRLRMQKYGATPEDRARLRITVADADEKDEKRGVKAVSASRERRGGLTAV